MFRAGQRSDTHRTILNDVWSLSFFLVVEVEERGERWKPFVDVDDAVPWSQLKAGRKRENNGFSR